MNMIEKLQSAAPEEAAYFYSGSAENEMGRSCIGHLRGDFGRSGEEFWVTWFPRNSPFETSAFKDQLGKVFQAIGDQDVLKSRQHMLHFCSKHPEARIAGARSTDVYGFRVETKEHRYYLRCFPFAGNYNFYLYCYARPERVTEQHWQAPSAPASQKKKTEPQR
jgi:hypothetical protein